MADDQFELTRRKALAGLGTIGAASAGAGLGTSAYFNDTESFEGNSMTAGTLDLMVTADGFADQGETGPIQGDWYSEASEDGDGGTVGAGFTISDLKPGDSYDLCWCISNDGNPAAVRAFIPTPFTAQTGRDNGTLDEDSASDLGVDEFETLLSSDYITVTNNIYSSCDTKDESTLLHGPIGYDGEDNDNEYGGGLGEWVTSLSDYEFSSQDGVPVGSHDGDGDKKDGNLDTGIADYIHIGTGENADYQSVAYCITINVSPDAGNEIQGASTSFDLEFIAEQVRHNDHPFSDMATRPAGDTEDW